MAIHDPMTTRSNHVMLKLVNFFITLSMTVSQTHFSNNKQSYMITICF